MNSRLKLSTALRASESSARARFGVANPKQAVATTAIAASAVTPANFVLIAASPQFASGTARRPAGTWLKTCLIMRVFHPARTMLTMASGVRSEFRNPPRRNNGLARIGRQRNLVSQVQGSGRILEAPAYTRSQKRRDHQKIQSDASECKPMQSGRLHCQPRDSSERMQHREKDCHAAREVIENPKSQRDARRNQCH